MIVLVCGGREYNNENFLFTTLDAVDNISEIVHGGCRGADALASRYSQQKNIKEIIFIVNWKLFGKSAGPRRNELMAQYLLSTGLDCCIIAFAGGIGTSHMISVGNKYDIKVQDMRGE